MKRFIVFALIIVVILGGYVSYQQSQVNHVDDLPSVAKINLKVESFTTSNIPVWLVQNKDTDLVCFKITFKGAGSAQDPVPGTTKMLASMLNEGTMDMDSEAFQNFVLNHQIQLSPDYDSDNFGILIRTTVQQLPHVLTVLKQIFSQLRIATDDLERNRQDMLVTLEQSKHDPFSVSSNALNQLAFKKHPYFVSIDDQIAGIKNITAPQVRDVFKRFGRDNMLLMCAGNIDEKTIKELVTTLTAILPEKSEINPIAAVEFETHKKLHHVHQPIPQSVIRFAMPAINPKDPDYYAFELLESIFGGTGMKSRLFFDIRERRGLAYYAQTGFSNMDKVDMMKGVTGVSTENEDQVIQLIKDIMIQLQKEGVTPEELDFEKQHTSGTYALHFDSLKETVQKLAEYQVDGLGPNYVNEYPQHLEEVTLDQVKKVAQKYLDTEKMIVVVTGQGNAVVA